MRSSFLVVAVVLALMGATTAEAAGPGAGVLCGNCDGSGYCQTQSVASTGQATGGTVWANYHWCTDWRGNVWGNYGWATHNNPCCEPAIRWAGWNPAYGTGSGYDATGQFAVSGWIPLVGWVTGYYDNVRACIWVDGYGNWGRC